ncbi:ATP-binding protein, partial [Salmonella enterica]|uniref:ATP-binding protein n=1 Tax=Salmonella enterica TaxID=28901 RepID=UPI003D274868
IEASVFSPQALVEAAVSLLGPQAHARGNRLSWAVASEVPRWATGDEGRLRQILVNLVGNAIKFTRGGEVRIAVSADCLTDRGFRL